jgi:hypothetical protein
MHFSPFVPSSGVSFLLAHFILVAVQLLRGYNLPGETGVRFRATSFSLRNRMSLRSPRLK